MNVALSKKRSAVIEGVWRMRAYVKAKVGSATEVEEERTTPSSSRGWTTTRDKSRKAQLGRDEKQQRTYLYTMPAPVAASTIRKY